MAEIKYHILSTSERFSGTVHELLQDSQYQASENQPNVVVVDKALPDNLLALAQCFQAAHPAPRLVLAGATLSVPEVHRLHSIFSAFVTKEELPFDLSVAVEAAAMKRRYLSPNVQQPIEERGEEYLQKPVPEITEEMKQALRYKIAGHGGKTTKGFNITNEMAKFKKITGTEGPFAPFRAALHFGLIPFMKEVGCIRRAESLQPQSKETLADHLRHIAPRYGYRNPHPQAVLYNNRLNLARSELGRPHPFALMCAAVAAGIIELDEVGTK